MHMRLFENAAQEHIFHHMRLGFIGMPYCILITENHRFEYISTTHTRTLTHTHAHNGITSSMHYD
jgi:hypothetical protein